MKNSRLVNAIFFLKAQVQNLYTVQKKSPAEFCKIWSIAAFSELELDPFILACKLPFLQVKHIQTHNQ